MKPRLLLGAALTLVVAACATDTADPANTSTTTTSPDASQTTTAVHPLVGTWLGFDPDGSGLELEIRAGGDGFDWVFTDEHADLCLDFGQPVAFQLSGVGQQSNTGAELTSSRAVCLSDWGEVEVDFSVTMEMSLDGDTLTDGGELCLHMDDPNACGGSAVEIVQAPPNYSALLDTYGEDWLTQNYRGDSPEELAAQLNPCSVTTGPAATEYEVIRTEMPDLPRHITCGPGGVWVYLRGADGAVLLGEDLQLRTRIEGVGAPRGNKDLVVFHTFNTVEYLQDPNGTPTRVADYPDSDFVRDAVPIGNDLILVTTNGLTLYDLEGSVVWTVPGNGYDQITEGDDEFWAATPTGELARIPQDGSEPLIIEVPDAVWGGSANLRPAPIIQPVPGGAVFTNADNTVQFVSDEGVLGTKIDVGTPPRGDGGHIIPVRPLCLADGYVYTEDIDKNVFRFSANGTGQAEQVESKPSGEAAMLSWYFEDGDVVGRDSAGSAVVTVPIGVDPQNFTWVGSSLFITIQGGSQGAPGEVIEIRPVS